MYMKLEQQDQQIAVKVQDRRHFDRLTDWLAERGFTFRSNTPAGVVYDGTLKEGARIKVLVANTETWTISVASKEDLDNELSDWLVLDTSEFKELVEYEVSMKEMKKLPKSYRLIQDSAECLAGTVVAKVGGKDFYKVVTPETRTFPEDSDAAFYKNKGILYSRKTVEEQPNWFEQVYQLNQYVTKVQYLDISEQIKNGV